MWHSVRAGLLLEMARAHGDSVLAIFLDGYTASMPIDALMDDYSIMAFAMWGKPLPREHGFPLRLVVPNWRDCKSSKYLSEIKVVNGDDVIGY